MSTITFESATLRAAIAAQRAALDEILKRYAATNPRLFGSVARGDATATSDVDLLVDLHASGGNELLRVAGIAEEFSQLLGHRVDVVTATLLRAEVSATAMADAVPLRADPTPNDSPTSSTASTGVSSTRPTSAPRGRRVRRGVGRLADSTSRWRTTRCFAILRSSAKPCAASHPRYGSPFPTFLGRR